jgi:hypothetical protein
MAPSNCCLHYHASLIPVTIRTIEKRDCAPNNSKTQVMPFPSNLLERAYKRSRGWAFLTGKDLVQRLTRRDPSAKQVVFVAGVQRSGTNMMMSVLERSLETDVYHERDPRAFDAYEMRPPEVIRDLIDRSPAPWVVIKSLCELQDIGTLLDGFAPAKAIWVVRDLDDVVNSHLQLWTGMPESIRRIVEEGDTAGWRGRGMSADTLSVLKDHYHPGLDNPSACALFWYFRNILFFEQNLDRDPRVRLVRYEHLVTNPHETFGSLFSFLGLRYTQRVSRRVFASSVRKANPPAIDPAIRLLCEDLNARLEHVLTGTVRPFEGRESGGCEQLG